MENKLYLLGILILIANFEWLFVFSNLDQLKLLREVKKETANTQEEYLQQIIKNNTGTSMYLGDKKQNDGFIRALDIPNVKPQFNPNMVILPSIGKSAPIYDSVGNLDELLNKGVINYKTNKEGIFIFGHSSSPVKSPYQFIFTNITKIGKGDIVSLESDREVRMYKYINAFYKKPDKLNEIQSKPDSLYLITCYPFNSNYTRYVVELELSDILKK